MDNPKDECESQGESQTSGAPSISIHVTTVTPTLLMRVYFSSYHLFAASHFLELAKEIEENHDGGPIFDVKHRAYVINSIYSSVAFLEAAINEIFQDAADEHQGSLAALAVEIRTRIASFCEISGGRNRSSFSVLKKYQMVLLLAGKPQFERGNLPYRDAQSLIELRNELTHYKPESLGGSKTHRLEKKLKDKFSSNKLMTGAGNPFFPDHCLGFGCAEWGLRSCRSFVDHFFRELGVTPNYQRMPFIDK